MNMQSKIELAEIDEQAAIRAAIAFLRNDMADLTERAEALGLEEVFQLLDRASRLCAPEVLDSKAG